MYERSSDFHTLYTSALPVARVLASQSEVLGQLDESGRLVPHLASESDRSGRVCLHCTYKDEGWDRRILDARPPNAQEIQLNRFVWHMANASMLLEIALAGDEVLAAYLDDIRDMCYVFNVSDDRARRNTFAREARGADVRGLRAFPAGAKDSDMIVGAF